MSSRVRLARSGDRAAVLAMVDEYLLELQAFGSEIVPGKRTTKAYDRILREVVAKGDGALVVDEEARAGFSLAIWQPLSFETTFGRTAMSLGTYVRPAARRDGLGKELRAAMHRRLAELGFRTLLVGIYDGNEAALEAARFEGVRFYMTVGARPLVAAEEG